MVIQGFVSGGNPHTYAVVDLPDVRYHWFALPRPVDEQVFPQFIAVSSGLDQVAWLTRDVDGTGTDSLHITTSAGDHVVATLPDTNPGRCGTPDDSKTGAYTRSGDHLFVLDQPLPQENSLLVVEGETPVLSMISPTGGWPGPPPQVAVWSSTSETLYYRLGTDVWTWTPGSNPVRFLPGVLWYYPTISANGAHLAYLAAGGAYLIDLAHKGNPQLIGDAAWTIPVFLNSTQLWYRSVSINHGCAGTEAKPLVYNIVDGTSSPSIIDQVFMVWPATSANY